MLCVSGRKGLSCRDFWVKNNLGSVFTIVYYNGSVKSVETGRQFTKWQKESDRICDKKRDFAEFFENS